jgi:homoserine kinase type II
VDQLVRHVRDLEHRLDEFRAKALPEQLIHGDLHYDNVLIDPSTNKVTGLLDFEYCAFDWRAMELAVCLSKYASEENALEYMTQFVKGFAKTATLTEDEIDSIADLMVLRIISNVVFFVGRVISGEDEPDQLVTRAGMYNTRIGWLLDNRAVLRQMIAAEMGKVML